MKFDQSPGGTAMQTKIRTTIATLAATFAVTAAVAPVAHAAAKGDWVVNDIKIGNKSQFTTVDAGATAPLAQAVAVHVPAGGDLPQVPTTGIAEGDLSEEQMAEIVRRMQEAAAKVD